MTRDAARGLRPCGLGASRRASADRCMVRAPPLRGVGSLHRLRCRPCPSAPWLLCWPPRGCRPLRGPRLPVRGRRPPHGPRGRAWPPALACRARDFPVFSGVSRAKGCFCPLPRWLALQETPEPVARQWKCIPNPIPDQAQPRAKAPAHRTAPNVRAGKGAWSVFYVTSGAGARWLQVCAEF